MVKKNTATSNPSDAQHGTASTSTAAKASSASMTPRPAAGADVQAGKAPLSSAQQVIHKLLHVETTRSPAETFMVLSELESKDASDDRGTVCCFDLATVPSWASHSVCSRCRLLNELWQAYAMKPSNAALKALLDTAVAATACTGKGQRSTLRHQPTLPPHLLDMILERIVEHMRRTRDSRAVRRLMHTNLAWRYKIARIFEPVVLLDSEYTQGRASLSGKLTFPSELVFYLWEMAARHLSLDFAVRRHERKELVVPFSNDDDNEEISTARSSSHDTGRSFVQVKCAVHISAAENEVKLVEKRVAKVFTATSKKTPVTNRDACTLLRSVFEDEALQAFPRLAQPYGRAFRGRFETLPVHFKVAVTLTFSEQKNMNEADDEAADDSQSRPHQTWTFVNNVPEPQSGLNSSGRPYPSPLRSTPASPHNYQSHYGYSSD